MNHHREHIDEITDEPFLNFFRYMLLFIFCIICMIISLIFLIKVFAKKKEIKSLINLSYCKISDYILNMTAVNMVINVFIIVDGLV